MSYQKLFSLDIFHDYYQDEICSDFDIEPTSACERIIKGHRLILKKEANGIQVIADFNEQGEPEIQLAKNVKFTFILKLNNPNFIGFTDMVAQPNSDSFYLFKNQNITSNKPLELGRKLENVYNISLPRMYGVWGVVEIYNNASFSQNNNYTITFQSKKQHWKYYLVTNKDTPGNELEIKDQEPMRSPKISFAQREIEQEDRVVAMIAQQFPDSQQYLFQSETEIGEQEVPRRNIQLLKKVETENSKTVWIEHLPNPPNSSAIKIINLLTKV